MCMGGNHCNITLLVRKSIGECTTATITEGAGVIAVTGFALWDSTTTVPGNKERERESQCVTTVWWMIITHNH